MRDKNRLVYSTDPQRPSEPERSPDPSPPGQQTVYVARDRKGRRGKTVTIISGLKGDATMKKKLLKRFKGLCGAGGTLKDGDLEVQGDHRDRLIGELRSLGYKVKQKGG